MAAAAVGQEKDGKDVKSASVVVRVQYPRQAKIQLGHMTSWYPTIPGFTKSEKLLAIEANPNLSDLWKQNEAEAEARNQRHLRDLIIEIQTIKRYGEYFQDVINEWKDSSQEIRGFFLNGIIPTRRWRIRKVILQTIPAQLNMETAKQVQSDSVEITGYFNILERLMAFWMVMNGNLLQTMPQDTILFRGVDYDATTQLAAPGYVVENVLTNWSSSWQVAKFFSGSGTTEQKHAGSLLQCKFPKGTKFYFTGNQEFEFIVPGGRFHVAKQPQIVKTGQLIEGFKTKSGIPTEEVVHLVPLVYEPLTQKFDWPSKSSSPTTRSNYPQTCGRRNFCKV
jgi:hypothetical protein